jgi:hypothetical protein
MQESTKGKNMQRYTKQILGAAALVAATAATPAMATDFIFDFTKQNTQTSGTTTFRDYSLSKGGETVKVRASAWSITGGRINDAYLGAYGGGLGVTNDGEDGSGTSHVIDNSGRQDFVLLQFSAPVLLTQITVNPFEVNGSTDADTTIGWGKSLVPWDSVLALDGTQANSFTSKLTLQQAVGTGATNAVNVSGSASNLWMVAASLVNSDGKSDGFKLSSVKVTTPVPEPATWMMMILGFGAIGLAVRRQRATTAQPTLA